MPTIDPAARLRGSQKGAQVAAELRRERAEADLLEDDIWEEIVIARAPRAHLFKQLRTNSTPMGGLPRVAVPGTRRKCSA